METAANKLSIDDLVRIRTEIFLIDMDPEDGFDLSEIPALLEPLAGEDVSWLPAVFEIKWTVLTSSVLKHKDLEAVVADTSQSEYWWQPLQTEIPYSREFQAFLARKIEWSDFAIVIVGQRDRSRAMARDIQHLASVLRHDMLVMASSPLVSHTPTSPPPSSVEAYPLLHVNEATRWPTWVTPLLAFLTSGTEQGLKCVDWADMALLFSDKCQYVQWMSFDMPLHQEIRTTLPDQVKPLFDKQGVTAVMVVLDFNRSLSMMSARDVLSVIRSFVGTDAIILFAAPAARTVKLPDITIMVGRDW